MRDIISFLFGIFICLIFVNRTTIKLKFFKYLCNMKIIDRKTFIRILFKELAKSIDKNKNA